MNEEKSRQSRRAFLRMAAAAGGGGLAAGCSQSPTSLFGIQIPEALQFGPTSAELSPFSAPDSDAINPVTHCLNRLTFGVAPGEYDRVVAMGNTLEFAAEAFVEEQLSPQNIDDRMTARMVRRFEYLQHAPGDLFNFNIEGLLDEMLQHTIRRAVQSRQQLREVMVRFWSDHFNIDSSKGDCRWLTAAHDRDVIRKHAMGTFPELLRATATSPAMLWYLDGRVNEKKDESDQPNENYARELLELHTLGVDGGYTQEDVMDAARVLTGWTVDEGWLVGRVKFETKRHDTGEKSVLGQKISAGGGKHEIDQLLDIVALHPSTANYLATKLCTRFIGDDPPKSAVDAVASKFLSSKGDISQTLRALFATSEFKSSQGNKLKTPFHFIVSCLRATGGTTDGRGPLLEYLHRMGNAPFHFPTPDGYPEEAEAWGSTIFWRLHFADRYARNKIDGTECDFAEFRKMLEGSDASVMPWFFGRKATANEAEAWNACDESSRLALVLGAPAFQMF